MRQFLFVCCVLVLVGCKNESASIPAPAPEEPQLTNEPPKQPQAIKATPTDSTKTPEPVTVPVAVSPDVFFGRWKLVNEKGVTSSYLNVWATDARRDHVPAVPCKWEVIGNEARLSWEDGYRDIMRFESGKFSVLGLGKVNDNWESTPLFKLDAIKIGAARQPNEVASAKLPKQPAPKPVEAKPVEVVNDKPKTGIAAYDDFVEPFRTALIKNWEARVTLAWQNVIEEEKFLEKIKSEVEQVKSKFKSDQVKIAKVEAMAKNREDAVSLAKTTWEKLVKNDPAMIEVGVFPPISEVKVGTFGRIYGQKQPSLSDARIKVFQVIDKNSVLLGIENPDANKPIAGNSAPSNGVNGVAANSAAGKAAVQSQFDKMRGDQEASKNRPFDSLHCTRIILKSSTAGLTDDKMVQWKDLIGDNEQLFCSGTKTYGTVGGSSKTVFVFEVLTPDAMKSKPDKKK